MTPPRVVIVGAGPCGLALAFRLHPHGIRATVLEASPRPGGNVGTLNLDGFRVEVGPNGFLDGKPGTLQLCRDLGLGDRLIPASEGSRTNRFVYHAGCIHKLPGSPRDLLTTAAALPGRQAGLGQRAAAAPAHVPGRRVGGRVRLPAVRPRGRGGVHGGARHRHPRRRPGAAVGAGGVPPAGGVRAAFRQRGSRGTGRRPGEEEGERRRPPAAAADVVVPRRVAGAGRCAGRAGRERPPVRGTGGPGREYSARSACGFRTRSVRSTLRPRRRTLVGGGSRYPHRPGVRPGGDARRPRPRPRRRTVRDPLRPGGRRRSRLPNRTRSARAGRVRVHRPRPPAAGRARRAVVQPHLPGPGAAGVRPVAGAGRRRVPAGPRDVAGRRAGADGSTPNWSTRWG